MSAMERRLRDFGFRAIAGTDEVGRGCLAGPVVAACVILESEPTLFGVNDSKLVDREDRIDICRLILRRARAVAVGVIEPRTIDAINILRASKLAMIEAVENLAVRPDVLLLDAVTIDVEMPQVPLIGGDRRSVSIAAASIVAKVYRDLLMESYHDLYPVYDFRHNRGYATEGHQAALKLYGPSPIHRRSFEGVESRCCCSCGTEPMAIQRDKIIASAEKLVAKGKIEPAIKEYERLLDDNPSDVNTLNRIGDLWVRINRNDEAVKVFAKIADHYSKDGFFLKAIAIYKKINKLDPSKLDIYARLADLYAKQGLAMEAKSQYQVLADYYLKHGDPGNALAIYRKISELDPNSINVHVKLADLYSQNNQKKEALKEYDRVGRMLLKRSMLDEAVQVFKKALKIDAGNVELVESLVTALLEAKDYENAIQIVQTAIETSSDDPRLLAIYGRILLTKGRSERRPCRARARARARRQ